jgi:Ca2+-binding RTX toxin-like protein
VFGNEGNDSIDVFPGSDTIFAGQGDDSVFIDASSVMTATLLFGGEGGDTLGAGASSGSLTVTGGQDSADAADSLIAGTGNDQIFGNGGADTIDSGGGNNVIVGGFDADSLLAGAGNDFIFGNEGNDTIHDRGGDNTVFAGVGDDTVLMGDGRDTVQGNEGNDTIEGRGAADTLAGGSGGDVFGYFAASDDGNNAGAGGPVELITDLNWSEDKFNVSGGITSAGVQAAAGATLGAAADAALLAQQAVGGMVTAAAQFDFGGRTYVAINQDAAAGFNDAGDLLIDITGAAGTIGVANFV